MQMIISEYKKIVDVFEQHSKSFEERKEKINTISFSKMNWSNSFLDFIPYSSIINQLNPPKIFEKEKLTSIKNHFINDRLIYSFHNENENWGSVFVDYEKGNTKWLLFSENYEDKMVLQQLKVVYYQSDKITKALSYIVDEDAEEETFIIDLFKYNKENKIESIVRNGFYEIKVNILPERKISFFYHNDKVKIYSTQEIAGNIKKQIIYEGEEL